MVHKSRPEGERKDTTVIRNHTIIRYPAAA